MLLKALAHYQKYSTIRFSLVAITVDIFGDRNFDAVQKFCDDIGVAFHVVRSNIFDIVFNERKEKNPCSLCARLRRGTLNSKAVELGCNKIALGHHADDFVETFIMSIAKENRLSTFWPVTYLSNQNLFVIRPFIFMPEKLIESSLTSEIPIMKNPCPADKKTERERVKNLLVEIEKTLPNFKNNLFESIVHKERYNLLDKFDKKIN